MIITFAGTDAPAAIKVLGHQHWWLPGGNELEIGLLKVASMVVSSICAFKGTLEVSIHIAEPWYCINHVMKHDVILYCIQYIVMTIYEIHCSTRLFLLLRDLV